MSEKLSGWTEIDTSKNDKLNEKEKSVTEYYHEAVQEIEEEYRDKTPFEKEVMFDLVLSAENEKKILEREESAARDAWNIFRPSKEKIKRDLEYDFDFGMNCGGFALEVFACVFSGSDYIDDAKRNILAQFPFVREIEDGEELAEDEYKVIYRHVNGGKAHHFVKCDENGILEKDGSGPVRKFEAWSDSLGDAPEVTFAVKRDGHEIEPRDENGERLYSYIV